MLLVPNPIVGGWMVGQNNDGSCDTLQYLAITYNTIQYQLAIPFNTIQYHIVIVWKVGPVYACIESLLINH